MMKRRTLQGGLSGDAMLLMMIKLVTIVLGFAITRLLSQYLSVYDYGTYSQIMLIVSTVNTLTILGMIDGVNYFYCSERDEEKREAYISTIFALQCIVSVIAGCIVMLLSGQICRYFGNPNVADLLIFSAALPLFINLLSMLQVLLVSVGKAKMLAVRNLVVSLARLAAVILVVSLVRNVAVVLVTTLVLDVVQIAFFLWILRRNRCVLRLDRVDFSLFGRIFRYCAPMGIFTAISALNRDCDKYLIALMTDTETLAVYSNASKVLPFDIIMSSFCTVLMPEITRLIAADDRPRAAELYRLFLEIAYVSTGILCGAALAASPQLMKLLYSDKYLSGLSIFCIYILVDLLRFTNITMVLSASGKTKLLMLLSIGSLGMNVGLNAVLYHWMGVTGPAFATLLTTFALGVCILTAGAKELGCGVKGLFDGRFLLVFFAEILTATWLFSMLRNWLDSMGVHYFITLVLIAGAYCLCMLLLHGKRLLGALKRVNEVSGKNE